FEQALRGGAAWQLLQAVPALVDRHLAEGRLERARDVLRRVMAHAGSARDIAAVVVKVAELGLARELPQALRWLEAETGADAPAFAHLYRALSARGGVERERAARAAAAAFAQLGYRLFEAWACELAGDLAAARERYAASGATHDVRRLAGAPHAEGEPREGRLTPREAQVAELAASGLSNRAIGEQLSLSDRTVEHHLGVVFGKLGLRSRVELAARRGSER
ncbi:MAG: hypothetical protein QOI11_2636, partial [Candidatus Eremiobacteraeota bacterium]|nr:hypothetical protein [Candidatus Eremiobacteraeota bacterium]